MGARRSYCQDSMSRRRVMASSRHSCPCKRVLLDVMHWQLGMPRDCASKLWSCAQLMRCLVWDCRSACTTASQHQMLRWAMAVAQYFGCQGNIAGCTLLPPALGSTESALHALCFVVTGEAAAWYFTPGHSLDAAALYNRTALLHRLAQQQQVHLLLQCKETKVPRPNSLQLSAANTSLKAPATDVTRACTQANAWQVVCRWCACSQLTT